ncbi:MAG: argininosuccinate lyase [Flavobacteriales bacterium AspAUS03]
MKLWQKDFQISEEIERFTVGKDRELDLLLAPHDVIGTLAHISMLESIGLLSKGELSILTEALRQIYVEITLGDFQIEERVEDVHSKVELLLTQRLGEVGKKIHSGRSRNDQVLVDLKLFIRAEIQVIVNLIQILFESLIQLSERHKDLLIPGYTHYQIAMPSSFGLWFAAYAESFVDDLLLLQAAYRITNKNPLGSAAGYGSSFHLDRRMTTELLGFEDLNYNVVYAQMGRGKTERIVAEALSAVAATLGKFSQDVCLYMGQNFGFISFPDHLTTGSSIMPHKKNPDVFELIRAHCNRILALPNEIVLIMANLSSGYHRDLQLIKESFLPVFDQLKSCLGIAQYMLGHIIVRKNILQDEKYQYIFSVEVVNQLVQGGISFRDAYKKVGLDIQQNCFEPLMQVTHSHEGSIGNLCNEDIRRMMERALEAFHFEKAHQAISRLLGQVG